MFRSSPSGAYWNSPYKRRFNFDVNPRTSEAEAKAIMGMIEREFSNPNLTPESRDELTKQYNAAEERLYELAEVQEAIRSMKNIALDCKVQILYPWSYHG